MNRRELVVYFAVLFILVVILNLAGCASQNSLLVPGVERVCAADHCFLRANAELVHARCTQGLRRWDSGQLYDPNGTTRARCCTVFRGHGARFAIWVTEGEEECLAHEFCHVREFENGRGEHDRCHDFGFGRGRQFPGGGGG